MLHFTIDGFRGFRSRFDDAHLIQEVLEDAPAQLGLKRAMPAFVLPYYNGVVPEDCGISAFVFLAGGHFTLHTFSFRETYFADLVAPDEFDPAKLRALLEAVFPCALTSVRTVERQDLKDSEPDVENDFGPHLFLNIDAYQGPRDLDSLFQLFDRLPAEIGMTPIMRPYVIRDTTTDGQPVLSALTMIAESHVSLHVFPREERAYFDIFSCRFFDRSFVVPRLLAQFPGGSVQEALVGRGSRYRYLRTERGYIDVLASTAANITEALLDLMDGTRVYRVDPEHVDDVALAEKGYYRFYDHIVSSKKYDQMETVVTGRFFDELADTWRKPTIPTVRLLFELGSWLNAKGFEKSILATAARNQVPVFCCGLPDGPIGEGYSTSPKAEQAPVVDFFKDYRIATDIMDNAMMSKRGTSVVFLGGGVPKDFLQITATSVRTRHGNVDPTPHKASIQITTDNTVYGGLGGATLATECISWGKEAHGSANVMCFADVTIALPIICQGRAEHFGRGHRRERAKPLKLSEVF